MLKLTGYPIVDVGVAAITSYFEYQQPEEVTQDDLKKFSLFIEKEYEKPFYRSFLSVLFTTNCVYLNPTMSEAKKNEILDDILYGYQKEDKDLKGNCVFCGQPSYFRAYRQHIPLLTGEGTINFFPGGRAGLEVCPYCLLSCQAFPMGALKVEGRAMFVHSTDFDVMFPFAERFLEQNARNSLLQDKKDIKSLDGKYPKTIFINQLMGIDYQIADIKNKSVTVYHMTNYGTNADIKMFHLPSESLHFLHSMKSTGFRPTWNLMTYEGWSSPKMKGNSADDRNPFLYKNLLFEDLFNIRRQIHIFLQRHLLGGVIRRFKEQVNGEDVRLEINYWLIAEYLFQEVAGVDLTRIEMTKQFADKVAEYIDRTNDHNFFTKLYFMRSKSSFVEYEQLRNLFLRKNFEIAKKGNQTEEELLINFEEFIQVFEQWDGMQANWKMGRDLVLFRIIESLYKKDWFARNRPNIKEIDDNEEQTETKEEVI